MEHSLENYLLEGEIICWSGRTAPFRLLDLPFRSTFLLTWTLSALVSAIALLWLVPSFLSGGSSLGNTIIALVVVLSLPMLLSFRPITDKQTLERKVLYAITNLRAIAIVDGKMMSLLLQKGMPVSIQLRDGECGTLCIGSASSLPERFSLSRAITGVPLEPESNQIQGLLFYHIPHPEQLLCFFT